MKQKAQKNTGKREANKRIQKAVKKASWCMMENEDFSAS